MGRKLGQSDNEFWAKGIIRKSGITLGALAARLFVTEQYLSMVLSNRVVPSKELEERLEEAAFQIHKSLFLSKDARDEKYKKIIETQIQKG